MRRPGEPLAMSAIVLVRSSRGSRLTVSRRNDCLYHGDSVNPAMSDQVISPCHRAGQGPGLDQRVDARVHRGRPLPWPPPQSSAA